MLFCGCGGLGVGAGGFAAEIEQVGTIVEELEGLSEGGWWREEVAAVREAVGRDVDDAHEERAIGEGEGAGF